MMQIGGQIFATVTKADAQTSSAKTTPLAGSNIQGKRTAWRELIAE